MASYNELNALIDAYINRNGVQAITGQILNGVLKAMVEQLGRGYTIMGAATPTTDPGTPDGPECYFASTVGTYTDFDGLQVAPGELALLCYTPTDGWTKNTIYEGFQEVQATIDGNVGTPSVGVSYADGVLSFDFRNMKGNPGQNGQDGQDGDPAGFGTIGADITGGVGTPGVTVESSGPATAKNLQFHFTNLKGETGVTSVVATVDNTTGTPACTVSLVGQQLTLAFSGLKGAQGDTGVSADYPITIVNNLTTDDAASALSAAQGVVLQGEITQLEAKVDYLGGYDDTITPVWTQGKRLNESGQVLNSGNQLYASDFIQIVKGPTTILRGVRDYAALSMPCVVIYNASQQVVGYKYGTGNVDITSELVSLNASYIRLSHYDDGVIYPVTDVRVTQRVNQTLATPQFVEDTVQDAIDSVPTVSLAKNTQFKDLLEGYRNSVNEYYLANGVLSANSNWCSLVDYVPVSANTKYALARNYKAGMQYITMTVAFYKSDKTYLDSWTGTSNNAFTTPANTEFIRISVVNTNYDVTCEDDFDNIYLAQADDGYSVHTIDTAEIVVNGLPKTPLFGKSWALFGDSITEKNIRSNVNYHDYIRSELNVITNNFAIGGAGYKNRDDNGNAIYQTIYANKDSLKDFDFITIMGGVNDCTRGTFATILGTIDDTFSGSDFTGVTNNTIFACFKEAIELIFQYAPFVHIAIISPLPAVTGGFTFNPNNEANNMSVFVSGCKQICARYGIPYLDLYHESGLRPWDDTVNNKLFRCISADSPDRLHPNEYGHKWFYPQVREFIKKLI